MKELLGENNPVGVLEVLEVGVRAAPHGSFVHGESN
jgi:hypothetical protein